MTSDSRPPQPIDVCIVGAGPAGSALAIRMAQLGYDVCVIERSAFPRSHIGESLSPGVWPQLKMLGAADTVADAGFRPCRTSIVKWESETAIRRDLGAGAGLLVDRARFDMLLLDCARAHGVRVLQPAVLRAQTRREDGWDLEVETEGGKNTIHAGFLADARGRSATSSNRNQRTGHRTMALYGYWRGSKLPREPRIEAGCEAWYWGVPLPDGTYNAIVFVDAVDFRAKGVASLTAAYDILLHRSGLMTDCRDFILTGPVRVADATPHLDGESIAFRSIKVGEAALALDPLSSSGVQKAINTALTAAVVINTTLRCQSRADTASAFYKSNLAQASEQHRRWAAQHYASAAVVNTGRFWQTRATDMPAEAPLHHSIDFGRNARADLRVALSPEAVLANKPCIVGDLIALRPALCHPTLDRPVAFLGKWEMADLLRPLQDGMALSELMDRWQIPIESKPVIAKWFLDHCVLQPHHQCNATKPDRYL
jgi:flavin-dependent dehydrogenase